MDGSAFDDGLLAFAFALEREPMGVAIPDIVALRYESVNAAYRSIARDKEMIGHAYSEVWPEAADAVVPLVREVIKTGSPWIGEDLELQIARTDGGALERAWFTFEISSLRG